VIARPRAVLIKETTNITPTEQATLRRAPREQHVVCELLEFVAELLVYGATKPHLRPMEQFSRQIRRHRGFEERLRYAVRHSDPRGYPRRPFDHDVVE